MSNKVQYEVQWQVQKSASLSTSFKISFKTIADPRHRPAKPYRIEQQRQVCYIKPKNEFNFFHFNAMQQKRGTWVTIRTCTNRFSVIGPNLMRKTFKIVKFVASTITSLSVAVSSLELDDGDFVFALEPDHVSFVSPIIENKRKMIVVRDEGGLSLNVVVDG